MALIPYAQTSEQCVFVQISDIHVGGLIENLRHRRVPGQKGHNSVLCEGLQDALDRLPDELGWPAGLRIPVVVSGDLTQRGMRIDLDLVARFLHGKVALRSGTWGLNLPLDPREIPGNHDHWNGTKGTRPRLNYNGALFPKDFPHHPRSMPPVTSPSGKLSIELFGVDSCSGFKDAPAGTFGQMGSVHPDEIKSLRALLAAARAAADPGVTTLRALVCHHSLVGPSSWKSCRMQKRSQEELLDVAREHAVSAVLTGHTHSFLPKPVVHGGTLHELRCASTLQGKNPTASHGFYLHQVLAHADGPLAATWHPHRYRWTTQGFQLLPLGPGEVIELSRPAP